MRAHDSLWLRIASAGNVTNEAKMGRRTALFPYSVGAVCHGRRLHSVRRDVNSAKILANWQGSGSCRMLGASTKIAARSR